MPKTLIRTLALLALAFALSQSVGAQECGFSAVTIYLNDNEGRLTADAKIEFSFKDEVPETAEHFQVITKTKWDEKRQAYVSRHGLCGQHKAVVLRISVEGFERAEQVLDLPFGQQGFVIKLKRQGDGGKASFEKLSCAERPSPCAKIFEENNGGTR